MKVPKKTILTAGPSITSKEINYVLDAVKNGWNDNWAGYLNKFEKAFAEFIGVKYALTTSSCTGAMHLALLALGIGKDDEVIVPDIQWVATASAVKYTGAEPVFVDVEKDTWCIDPAKIEEAITKKTKAIMPVHLYGHPSDMKKISAIAKKYKLAVVEDAAQAIGSLYFKKRPGSLGDIGTFSFQGAKIMTTGEGGMLVTDSKKLYEKAKFYGNHGRDPKGSFWIYEVGYKYKMNNISAALGLAQLERIESFVEKKREIYSWYKDVLGGIDGIALNVERKGIKNNYWMSSMVMTKKFPVNRDTLMKKLKEEYNVDTRTFFYPTSEFKPFKKRFNNPVSKLLGTGGINLPSGVNLKKSEVTYIAKAIREILKV